MRIVLFSLSVATVLFVFSYCNRQPETSHLLKQAEQLIEEYPDSAYKYIDSITVPEKDLSRKEYMSYLVVKVQSKYKTYRNINDDTLIFNARDYFTRHDNNLTKTALAHFYSGCVYREQQDNESAMANYKIAQTYAESGADSSLMGLIQFNMGDLLSIQGLYGEALERYEAAESLYKPIPKKQILCLSALGRMYLLLQLPDSAFQSFHRGLELASSIGDQEQKSLLAQNLSVAYSQVKQFSNAEAYLRRSFQVNQDSDQFPRYYLNFAKIFYELGRKDSIARYVGLLKAHNDSIKDNYLKASIYSFLANRAKANSNINEAFQYQEMRMRVLEDIMAERLKQSVYEVQQRYDYEQMRNSYYQKLLARQRRFIALLIVVVVGGTIFTVYWVRQKTRRFEAQRNIDSLKEMNRDLEIGVHQKGQYLRKELLWRFDVAKKVIKLNQEMKRPGARLSDSSFFIEQFNKIVYGEKSIDEVWEVMLHTFNEACPGNAEKIRRKFPSLTEPEFRICILTYAEFTINEISIILNLKHNTVFTYRKDLRKKLGIGPRGNIAELLDTILT
jgi:tetratricopeptide (TPR) repeat protein/DNA-binding CsgD family transcriptional regulator